MGDQADLEDENVTDLDELNGELDQEITAAGMRGNVLPGRPQRRHRSTRHRQDAAVLPHRKVAARTISKTYTTPDGKTFRPSMFLTLTCPSYGRVRDDGTPADPASYDYQQAARDALHFAALFDRFIQNLRRFLGYDVQYFAAVEPQRRLAPHIHLAMRPPCPAPSCAGSWPPLTTRSGGPTRPSFASRTARRRCGTTRRAPTSTRRPARSCPPGTRPSTPSTTKPNRCTSPASGIASTPRACWVGPRTRPAASAT
jgi:hypothetical protein